MNIEISIFSTWWDRPPKVKIQLDDTVFFHGLVENRSTSPLIVKFDSPDLDIGQGSRLSIELSEKSGDQTVLIDDTIVRDQLLHIDKIEINNIDLGYLKYGAIYRPNYPELWFQQQVELGNTPPATLTKADILGYNGTWEFDFTHPFHIWYLENLP
jgi:hypothetical protein